MWTVSVMRSAWCSLLHGLSGSLDPWIGSFRSSLTWLAQRYGPSRLPSPEAPIEEWWSLIALADRWYGFIKHAKAACLAHRRAFAQALAWEKSIANQLLSDDALAELDKPPSLTEPWACEKCDMVFASRRALAVHATKAHNYRALVQHYAIDGTYPCYCRIFHQRSRLMAHLRTMQSCLDSIRACFPPLPGEIILQLNQEDADHARIMKSQGWFGTKATQPARRCQGPLWLPIADSQEAAVMLRRWSTRRPPYAQPKVEALAGHCDAPAGPPQNNPEVPQPSALEP